MTREAMTTVGPAERAVLVGVQLAHANGAWRVEESLAELAELARTAGLTVVSTFIQRLNAPQSRHFIGKGKVEEIRASRDTAPYDVVIFDDVLSPSQQRNLEDDLSTKIMDRTGLILDIFAQHARTKEGRLQVELAQYEYRLPRLTRAWVHLSRQVSAVGARGGVSGSTSSISNANWRRCAPTAGCTASAASARGCRWSPSWATRTPANPPC